MTLPSAYSMVGELHITFGSEAYKLARAYLEDATGKAPTDRAIRSTMTSWAEAGILHTGREAARRQRIRKEAARK